jgi:carbamoyltransferase
MNTKKSVKILGLSFYYHDAAAALIIDGIPVAMSEEERFSRKKHDSEFPTNAINFVLEEGSISTEDLDYVVFYEKPFKILFSEHHLSHSASAYFCSPFEKSAILTVDGVGEWAVTTIGLGEGNKINTLKEIHFPHSLGLLYSAFTAFLGFEVNEGEYKVMGMAPYGKPKYVEDVRKLIQLHGDGSYKLDMSYFTFHTSLSKTFSEKFVKLFGEPRDPNSKFFTKDTGWPAYFGEKPKEEEYERLAKEQQKFADIAASLQKVLEDAMVNLANALYKLTKCDNLCIAGGVGLNSCANWQILKNTPFKEIFVQPAAGDAGGALGAALVVYHIGLNNERNYVMRHAYYGAEYSKEKIEDFLTSQKIPFSYLGDTELVAEIAGELAQGKVVGWFDGKFEWGPRALGHRSILADPRKEEMKDIVNTKIKFREPYRPFAPSILAEKAEEYFDLPNSHLHHPARYMLFVTEVKEDKKKEVPAITHVDGSARPQLVYKDQSPRYYDLIKSFMDITGVPLLMNTSFNLKGEPVVNTPENAYSTFIRSGLDILVLGNYVVRKK